MPHLETGKPIIEDNPHPSLTKAIEQGYEVWYEKNLATDLLTVVVKYGGAIVAEAEFSQDDSNAWCQNVEVNVNHRRRGIATAIYVFAENCLGKVLDNFWGDSDEQSEDAKALWASPNRPFGQIPDPT